MHKSVEDYIKAPYTRILIPNEDGSFSAEILEFSGCFAEGATPDEAMTNLHNAAISWLEVSIDAGQDIPEPFENQDFGGKIALRLPRSLHRQASRLAERDGISLNQFLVSAISARVGAEDAFSHLIAKYQSNMAGTQMFLNIPPTRNAISIQRIADNDQMLTIVPKISAGTSSQNQGRS